ncbi:MAG: hypothetical protein J7494_02565 [Sphingobium sp.]|nr:hypothetical protein [Sphingobium sp.]
MLDHPAAWIGAIIAILCLQLALIITHRPWLDEWQAVLISIQTTDFTALFEQLRYEGHPPLWFFLLRSLSVIAGSPEQTLILANLFYAAVGSFLILRFCPFPRLERLLLLTSEILLIEYFSLSRSLGLGAMLFFWALAAWRSRWVWLPIALLPTCDFLFGILSIILILFHFRDHRTRFGPVGLLLWLSLSIIAAWSVRPAVDVVSDPPYAGLFGFLRFLQQLGMNILPWQMIDGEPAWNGTPPAFLGILFAPLFVLLCWRVTRSDKVATVLLLGFVLFLGYFTLFVYPLYFRHTSVAALLLIGIAWLRAGKDAPLPREVTLWLAILSVTGILTAGFMLTRPFDTGREAVALIQARGLVDKPWYGFPAYRAITLAGESRMPFGDLETGCTSSFRRWNKRTAIHNRQQFLAQLRKREELAGSFYLVTGFDLKSPPPVLMRRIAYVAPGYDALKYYLWEIGGNAPAKAVPKPCVSGLRSF